MKSFRVYLPGGRTPAVAGWCVILTAMAFMIFGFARIWNYEGSLSEKELMYLKGLLVLGALTIIAGGRIILKMLGVQFSKASDSKSDGC